MLVTQGLVREAPVVVLGEPTAGVDVELRQGLWRFIQELNRDGHTIVLTTHYLEEAENLCNRIAMLKQGRIVALDTTWNLLNRFPGRYVSLKLAPERLPAALEPLVQDRGPGGRTTLALQDYAALENVMATLRREGIQVLEMEILQADLEDVFMQIMSCPQAL